MPRTTLNELLDIGLGLPAEQRLPWVESLGEEHAAVKDRLRALLARSQQADEALFHTLPKLDTSSGTELAHFQARAHAVGQELGAYRLERCLGAGAMGVVWHARRFDASEPREVAIKFAHVAARRPDLAARLAREQQLLAALDHPNIARSYEAGITDEGQPYLVLEYVEGRPLDQYCADAPLELPQRLRLFLQIVQAVAHAHERQIIHRDLKPANVMVDAQGGVKLLDFGIGKLLGQDLPVELQLSMLTGQPLTPAYASPEQVLGAAAGYGSDIYSLGVVLYELLTGVRPYVYKRGSNRALRTAILETLPIAPSQRQEAGEIATQLRGTLDEIVLTALNKSVRERHASAQAFALAVERVLVQLAGLP